MVALMRPLQASTSICRRTRWLRVSTYCPAKMRTATRPHRQADHSLNPLLVMCNGRLVSFALLDP